jgi:hypothetical protein
VNLKQAKLATGGGLLTNSKMPGYCYSIPAKECNVGAKLVKIAGSVCEGCYALKGFYQTYATSIDRALYARLDSLTNPIWVEAMSKLINHYCRNPEFWPSGKIKRKSKVLRGTFFRWDAAGDVQDLPHLRKMVLVAEATPLVSHWIPTREYKIVAKYRSVYGEFPANFRVRLSAHMVDGAAPSGYGLTTSTVVTDGSETCQATMPENKSECGDCRACWSPDVANVSYAKH